MMTLQERIAKIDREKAERQNNAVVLLPQSGDAYAQNSDRRAATLSATDQQDDRVAALPIGLKKVKNRRLNALQNAALKRSNGSATARPKDAIHV